MMGSPDDGLRLYPSKHRYLLMVFGSMPFVIAGIVGINQGQPRGWIPLLFFGAAMMLGLGGLLSKRIYLELTPNGFAEGTWWGPKRRSWSDIATFGVSSVGRTQFVRYRKHKVPEPGSTTAVARSLTNWDGSLALTYGMPAESLAALMDEWRQRYGRAA